MSQTVSSVVTEYLLDMQPGLWRVIATDDGTNVNRFIHDGPGIAQHENPSGDWHWTALDGLGTVRGIYDDTLAEVYAADRDPYGDLIAATGSNPTPFEYTGEPEDQNGLLHLRARYYDPSRGVFNSRDPLETPNRYGYVNANPINLVDRTGLIGELPNHFGVCVPDGSVTLPNIGGFGSIPFSSTVGFDVNGQGMACVTCPSDSDRRCNVLRAYADELYNCLPGYSGHSPISGRSERDFIQGNPGTCTLGGEKPVNAVDALAKLIEYGGQQFPNISTKDLIDDISCALLNVRGMLTVFNARQGAVREQMHPLAWEGQDEAGFNYHYHDVHSQIYHFWAFLNTSTQGSTFGIGNATLEIADYRHECAEGGGHERDARLTTVAERIGTNAASMSPTMLANTIRTTLANDFSGYLLPHYYHMPECRTIAEADLQIRYGGNWEQFWPSEDEVRPSSWIQSIRAIDAAANSAQPIPPLIPIYPFN